MKFTLSWLKDHLDTDATVDALAEAGKIQSFGQARARRWVMPPMPGFATSLLLPLS